MITEMQPLTTPDASTISDAIFFQLMNVMGIKKPNFITRCLHPIFAPPANAMSGLVVQLDRNIAEHGLTSAIKEFQGNFLSDPVVVGEELIPKGGPLMVVGNHPAAYDIVVLISAIKRDDLKVLHSDIPVLQMLPNMAAHGIPVPYNIPGRLRTVRSTIQHLKNGGAIFIFPKGNVEPDPTVSPGAEESLLGWSSSLELLLRSVPQTQTVVAISSGMLSKKWFNNPVIKMWKKYEQRQKVAEIFQIIGQLVTKKKPAINPLVIFSPALSVDELGGLEATEGALLNCIIEQARQLLTKHPQH